MVVDPITLGKLPKSLTAYTRLVCLMFVYSTRVISELLLKDRGHALHSFQLHLHFLAILASEELLSRYDTSTPVIIIINISQNMMEYVKTLKT